MGMQQTPRKPRSPWVRYAPIIAIVVVVAIVAIALGTRSSSKKSSNVNVNTQSSTPAQSGVNGVPLFYNDAKARQELGYTSRPYRQGIADAITWFREVGYLR